jgi:hypothetical protein
MSSGFFVSEILKQSLSEAMSAQQQQRIIAGATLMEKIMQVFTFQPTKRTAEDVQHAIVIHGKAVMRRSAK